MSNMPFKRFAITILLLLTVNAGADIQRWTDSRGQVHFGDRPPVNADASVVKVKINSYEAPSVEGLRELLGKNNEVVIYSASWCPVCKKAKKYFRKKCIAYTEYDIEKSAKGKRDYKKLGAKGVPVIIVRGQRLNGFSAAAFERIYSQPQ